MCLLVSDKTSTLPNGNPYGEFNMGDKVTASPTPKCPSDTSLNPNIMFNSDKALVGVEQQNGS